MLRRVAKAMSAKVRVILEPKGAELGSRLAESSVPWNRAGPAAPHSANLA
jgi:hypothetical protein